MGDSGVVVLLRKLTGIASSSIVEPIQTVLLTTLIRNIPIPMHKLGQQYS